MRVDRKLLKHKTGLDTNYCGLDARRGDQVSVSKRAACNKCSHHLERGRGKFKACIAA